MCVSHTHESPIPIREDTKMSIGRSLYQQFLPRKIHLHAHLPSRMDAGPVWRAVPGHVCVPVKVSVAKFALSHRPGVLRQFAPNAFSGGG